VLGNSSKPRARRAIGILQIDLAQRRSNGSALPAGRADPTSRNICGVPAVLCRRHPTDRSMSRGGADAHEAVSGAYGYRRPGDAGSAEEPGRDLPKMIAIIGFAVCGLLA
jgi:hypothetical protein